MSSGIAKVFPSPPPPPAVHTVSPAAGCWSLGVNGKGTPQTLWSWCVAEQGLGGQLPMVTGARDTLYHRQMQSHASRLVQDSKISDGIVEISYAR